jgi:hypothetical protein
MPIKRVAHHTNMTMRSVKMQAIGWTASTIVALDLEMAKEEGFIASSADIICPSTEVILQPPAEYRVMFYAFFLCGFSLPAQKFLCGLLFIYGVQLH